MKHLHMQNILASEIVDQLADAIIFADVHGIIHYWNAAAEALFGFTIEEALGQSLDLTIPERLRGARAGRALGRIKWRDGIGQHTLGRARHDDPSFAQEWPTAIC
jgi:PAS domain S-box-containing protein